MRRFLFPILFIAGLAPTLAAEAPAKQEPNLNPAKTTVLDCLTILGGLEEIDALHPVISNQGKPNEQVVNVPYEFGSATFRIGLSKDIRALRIAREDQQQNSQKEMLIIDPTGEIRDSNKKPDSDAWDKEHAEYLRKSLRFNERMKQLTSAPCSIDGLPRLKASELKLDKNEIRSGATAAASPLIDWDK